MALGIPLPGMMGDSLLSGLNTGSTMFSRIMQPILDREHQAQAAEQFKQRQAQADAQFKQQMALRQAQFARDGQGSGLRQQILQQQLLGLQHTNDPMYKFNQFKALQDMMRGGGNMVGQQAPIAPPQEMMGEGMGMFTPEGLDNIQAQPITTNNNGNNTGGDGIDYELLRKNPMLRGLFKDTFHVDPLAPTAQSPEEKQKMALDLFKEKEKIKQNNKSGDIATNKVLTQNQLALQAIDTVTPMIDEFIKSPDKVYGQFDFSPSKKAAYEAKTGGMIDMLVAAQALPQVKESVELVKNQVSRRANETNDAYIKRMKDFKKDLEARRIKAKSVVETKRVNTQGGGDDFAAMSDAELQRIAGGG